jgi:hypothetical protein
MNENEPHLAALMVVFNFTNDDLAANQSGKLTDSQKSMIPTWAGADIWHFIMLYLLIGGPCCLFTASVSSANVDSWFYLIPILIGLRLVWNMVKLLNKWSKLTPESIDSNLSAVEGIVTKHYQTRIPGQEICYLQVGGKRLYIKRDQYEAVFDDFRLHHSSQHCCRHRTTVG